MTIMSNKSPSPTFEVSNSHLHRLIKDYNEVRITLLTIFDKIDELEQKLINLNYKVNQRIKE